MESIQFTIKSQPCTNARNLSELSGKVISIEFVLSNIAQLKIKRKAHPQNHSSGINMEQTHSITWKQQGYVGNYYLAKQLNSVFFLASLPSSYWFYFFRRNNHLTRNASSHVLSAQFFKGEREIKQNLT